MRRWRCRSPVELSRVWEPRMMWVLWGHCVLTSVCSPSRILRMFSAPVTRTTGRPRRWVLKTFPYLSLRELWKREPWGRAAGQLVAPAGPFPPRPVPRRLTWSSQCRVSPKKGQPMEPLGRGRALARSRLRLQRSAHRCQHRVTSRAGASSPSAAASGQESPAGISCGGGDGAGGGGPQERGPAPRDSAAGAARRALPAVPARPRSPPAAGSPLGHIYIDIGHLRPIHLRR